MIYVYIYPYKYICIFNVTGSQFPKSEMQHNNSGLKNLSGMIFIIGNHLGGLESGGIQPISWQDS